MEQKADGMNRRLFITLLPAIPAGAIEASKKIAQTINGLDILVDDSLDVRIGQDEYAFMNNLFTLRITSRRYGNQFATFCQYHPEIFETEAGTKYAIKRASEMHKRYIDTIAIAADLYDEKKL